MPNNSPAQTLLTDEEIQDIADGFDIYGAKPEFARAIESALLSKLRAPVADDRAAFEAKAVTEFTRPFRCPDPTALDPDGSGDYANPDVQLAWLGFKWARAALASAPVADERAAGAQWYGPVRELLGHISDVLDDAAFDMIDRDRWNAVSTLVLSTEISGNAAPASATAIGERADVRAMLASFGAADCREGSRAVGHSGPENGEWEDYIEVPTRALDRIRAALASAPVAGEALNDLQALQWAEKYGIQWALRTPDAIREVIADAQSLAAPQASEDTGNPADIDELRGRVLSEISTFAGMVPEPDEDWDVWYCAAFDMLGSNVRKIFSDALDSSAAPQASEAQCSCPSGDGSLRHPCAVHGGDHFLDVTKMVGASEAVRDQDLAPWPDYAGNPIRHGDRIRHPEGLEGVVVRLSGYAGAHDAWCVAYQDRTVSRLSLQIGERGQAVVQAALSAQPGAQRTGGSDAE